MKIVVIGGNSFIGSKLVTELRRFGHQLVAAPQTSGLNNARSEILAEMFRGTQVVIDAAKAPTLEDQAILDFFQMSGHNLLAAEALAGVRHHITLSAVGIEHMQGSAYFRAKVVQENLVKRSGIPYTILQSTQLFELMPGIAQAATTGLEIHISDAKVQPVASDDAVAIIAKVSIDKPLKAAIQIAGPECFQLNELISIFLKETGDPRKVITDRQALYCGVELSSFSLIPQGNVYIGKVKFADWLRKRAQ